MTAIDKALLTAEACKESGADILTALNVLSKTVREMRTAKKEQELAFTTEEEMKDLLISAEKKLYVMKTAMIDIKALAIDGVQNNTADLSALRQIAAIAHARTAE